MTTASPTTAAPSLVNVFEERAEYLSRSELENFTAPTAADQHVLAKLRGPGAKLLSGPRGSGKSTYLRRAYFELLDDEAVLPVYVNYSRSLALEPLFHKHSDALLLFRQWLLMKIVVGTADSFNEIDRRMPSILSEWVDQAQSLIHELEVGRHPKIGEHLVSPSGLVSILESCASESGRSRVVLLMDDAAHAFSPEQQRDFFEVFRELRSRRVAPKAAVYPGITSYSANFHVGHEAELLEAWYRPDSEEYLKLMRSIVDRRLPTSLRDVLQGKEDLVDLLAYSAFGIPRGLLNMLSHVLGVDGETCEPPTRAGVLLAISDHADTIRQVFAALASKLPRFRKFIEIGEELQSSITAAISAFNHGKPIDAKSVVIAIQEPLGSELERILQFLEYAGVLRRMDSVSRGEKGVFLRFSVHYALLTTSNALALGKRASAGDLVAVFAQRDQHAFVRRSPESLLGKSYKDRCTLSLPPCDRCSAPRASVEQLFCMKCGAELSRASVYNDLLKAPIALLPLTAAKIDGIMKHTSIRVVQDILADDEGALRKVPYIGEVWQRRIRGYAEEFVSV